MDDAEAFHIAIMPRRQPIAAIGSRLPVDMDLRRTGDHDRPEPRGVGNTGRRHVTDTNGRMGSRGSRQLPEPLAGEAGLAMRHLGRIERGEGNPTVAILGRMAEVLDVHPTAFYAEHP